MMNTEYIRDYEISKDEESMIRSIFLTDLSVRSNSSHCQVFKQSIRLEVLNEFVDLIVNTSKRNGLNLNESEINLRLKNCLKSFKDMDEINVENVLYFINFLDKEAFKVHKKNPNNLFSEKIKQITSLAMQYIIVGMIDDYSCPFWWAEWSKEKNIITPELRLATCFFLRVKENFYVVTAAHNYERYENMKKDPNFIQYEKIQNDTQTYQSHELGVFFGLHTLNEILNESKEKIIKNNSADVVFIPVEKEYLARVGKKSFNVENMLLPGKGDLLVIKGFPKKKYEKQGQIFDWISLIQTVYEISNEKSAIIKFENDSLMEVQRDFIKKVDFPGLSGAPVIFPNIKENLTTLHLSGVVVQDPNREKEEIFEGIKINKKNRILLDCEDKNSIFFSRCDRFIKNSEVVEDNDEFIESLKRNPYA